MAEQEKKQENQLNIELDEKIAEGTYANLAIINHSVSEFVVDFVNVMPGTPKAKTGSKIDYAEVADLATGFSIKEHPNNALINTLIRIPAYLLENSQTDIRAIAKDINDLYANYLKDISDQLSKITRT